MGRRIDSFACRDMEIRVYEYVYENGDTKMQGNGRKGDSFRFRANARGMAEEPFR
jgi:hypothetical protein